MFKTIIRSFLSFSFVYSSLCFSATDNYSDLIKIVKEGNSDDQLYLAKMYAEGDGIEQNYSEAFKHFKVSADQGNSYAQFWIGYMYQKGKGVKQNYSEAIKYYKLAADQGIVNAKM